MPCEDDWPEDEGQLTPTDAVLMRPDGTALWIRIAPDQSAINAVLGDWGYGLTPTEVGMTFWAPMPSVLIAMGDEPHGSGEQNRLAEAVYRSLTGCDQKFLGPILAMPGDGAEHLFAAVNQHAVSVQTLINAEPMEADWPA